MPETVLTSFEVAVDLGVSDSRVRQMIKAREIPVAYVTRKAQPLMRPADIVAVKARRELARRQKAAARAERREAARKAQAAQKHEEARTRQRGASRSSEMQSKDTTDKSHAGPTSSVAAGDFGRKARARISPLIAMMRALKAAQAAGHWIPANVQAVALRLAEVMSVDGPVFASSSSQKRLAGLAGLKDKDTVGAALKVLFELGIIESTSQSVRRGGKTRRTSNRYTFHPECQAGRTRSAPQPEGECQAGFSRGSAAGETRSYVSSSCPSNGSNSSNGHKEEKRATPQEERAQSTGKRDPSLSKERQREEVNGSTTPSPAAPPPPAASGPWTAAGLADLLGPELASVWEGYLGGLKCAPALEALRSSGRSWEDVRCVVRAFRDRSTRTSRFARDGRGGEGQGPGLSWVLAGGFERILNERRAADGPVHPSEILLVSRSRPAA